jgi:hypothetical protein
MLEEVEVDLIYLVLLVELEEQVVVHQERLDHLDQLDQQEQLIQEVEEVVELEMQMAEPAVRESLS